MGKLNDIGARIQTVNQCQNRDYYGILSALKKLDGCSVVINTSSCWIERMNEATYAVEYDFKNARELEQLMPDKKAENT